MLSLDYILKTKSEIFNVGIGKGHTVLDVIKSFQKILNKKINFKLANKRKGDPEAIYCCTDKIKKKLKWMPAFNLLDMCKDSIKKK